MNEEKVWKELEERLSSYQAIETALTLLEWDSATLAPKKADQKTARMVGILSEMSFQALINDDVRKLKDKLAKKGTELSKIQRAVLRELERQYAKLEGIPPEEYRAFSELKATANRIWSDAKEAGSFDAFAPALEKIVEYQKKFADYRRKANPGKSRYDILLSDYEPEFDCEKLDEFFGLIKQELVPFIHQIIPKARMVDKTYNGHIFDVEKQKRFCEFLAEYTGFDRDRGVFSESAHPFTTNLHNEDVRITNHFQRNQLESAIFSVIHETGHAVYELQIADDLTQTLVGVGASMAMHESQSRFYENIMGRSREFWKPIYGKLQETFPEALSEVSLDAFIKGINRPEFSMIRTEADELTYPLHILVRYEIEKELMDGSLSVCQIPEVWNKKYKEYLGGEPKDDAEGALQDVHWSGGEFGYFPSYALGSAIAAQLYETIRQEIPFTMYLEEGNIEKIKKYLGEHIHRYGAVKGTNQLLKEVTGEEFSPRYYIEYLKRKYTKLYDSKQ